RDHESDRRRDRFELPEWPQPRRAACRKWVVTVVPEENMCLYVVDVDGDLRAPLRPELRHTIDALLARGERRIVLDLARLSAIDAAGIGELIRARDAALAARGVLHIAHPRGRG